ncbi:HD domain-containing protein, partial [candidate division KSB1 bacterium]|nr:HD domain-containing protein [candidate division KSB1 bacterium]
MIKDLKPGDKFVSFFILRKKAIRTKFNSDEIYLSLELGDASQRINGTVWEKPQEVYEAIELGDIMKVKATAIHFKDKLHLNIEKIRKAEESDEFDIKELVPVVDKDRDALLSHLDELIASVENSYLKELLKLVFTDREIREQFKDAPGGKLWHHNYLGGLLEHTLSVTDIADRVGQMYPNIKRDLIIAAGLLHDIGKISSYTYKTLIDFTDAGRLVGHIVIGAQMVKDKIREIRDFPKDLEMELTHLILSHQGKLEQASPVVPMTLEGLILYYADEIDSNANAYQRITKREKEPGRKWS